MKHLIEELNRRVSEPLDTAAGVYDSQSRVVVIGSCKGSLPRLLADGFPRSRITVFDGLAEMETLEEIGRSESGIRVESVSVSAEGGAVTIHCFNQHRLNGLAKLADAQTVLPNIRSAGTQTIPTVSLNQMLSMSDVGEPGNHVLVIAIPGLLSSLCVDTLVHLILRFRFVLADIPPSSLFECGEERPGLTDLMKKAGFNSLCSLPSSVYPFETLVFERDGRELRLRQLSGQLESADSRISELERLLAEAVSRETDQATLRIALEDARSALEQQQAANDALRHVVEQLQLKTARFEGQLAMVRSLYLNSQGVKTLEAPV